MIEARRSSKYFLSGRIFLKFKKMPMSMSESVHEVPHDSEPNVKISQCFSSSGSDSHIRSINKSLFIL